MDAGQKAFLQRIAVVVQSLPQETIEVLCEALECGALEAEEEMPSSTLQQRLLLLLPSASARAEMKTLFKQWKVEAPTLDSRQLAWALRAGAEVHHQHRVQQRLELVWTGPQAGQSMFRRTDQALLEVVERSVQRLTLVTFAAYELGALRDALVSALDRGVAVTMILESKKESGGKLSHDASASLGEALKTRVKVLGWPADKRPHDAQGKTGVLHAKCAVADGRWLFVSSANLTAHAHNLNLELGVLMAGAELAGQVEAHLTGLIQTGVLREID